MQEKIDYQNKEPREVLKEQQKKESLKGRVYDYITNLAKDSADFVMSKAFLPNTDTVRHKEGAVDRAYVLRTKIEKFFKNFGKEVQQKIEKEIGPIEKPEDLLKVRKLVLAQFKEIRQIYSAYLSTMILSMAFDKTSKIPQISPEDFVKNFDSILSAVGLIRSSGDLAEITAYGQEIRQGEQKNRLYDIYKDLIGGGKTVTAEERVYLGSIFLKFFRNELDQTVSDKYAKLTMPMILLNLAENDRLLLAREITMQAKNSVEAVRILEDWYLGKYLTVLQCKEIAEFIFKKTSSPEIQGFISKLEKGNYNSAYLKGEREINKKVHNLGFSMQKMNSALSTGNIYTLLGYEFIMSGALIGLAAATIMGIGESIRHGSIKPLVSLLGHRVTLGCAGIVAAGTEFFTRQTPANQPLRVGYSKGAISKLMDLGNSRDKKMQGIIENKFVREMTNTPNLAYLFIENFGKLDAYLSKITKAGTREINPLKKLDGKILEELFGVKLPDIVDGIAKNQLGIQIMHWWNNYKYRFNLRHKEDILAKYKESLREQGVSAAKYYRAPNYPSLADFKKQ